MTEEAERELNLILGKLEILRNVIIVAVEGMRQQQSAANDEVLSVMKDIRSEINLWMRRHGK